MWKSVGIYALVHFTYTQSYTNEYIINIASNAKRYAIILLINIIDNSFSSCKMINVNFSMLLNILVYLFLTSHILKKHCYLYWIKKKYFTGTWIWCKCEQTPFVFCFQVTKWLIVSISRLYLIVVKKLMYEIYTCVLKKMIKKIHIMTIRMTMRKTWIISFRIANSLQEKKKESSEVLK